jgi:hypothetical protein
MARILLAGSHGTPTSYDETCYSYSTCFSSSCTVYGYVIVFASFFSFLGIVTGAVDIISKK